MTQLKNLFPAAAKALLLAVLISATSSSVSWAEEETGPAFAPPVTKTTAPQIGPGVRGTSNFVVVLDPGHGKTGGHYSGCHFEYNGVTYYEDEITMKIASYTKQYLEQFSNYTVYLTKDSVETTVALDQRAAFAASVQADLFVSQHVDSALGNGTVKNAYGASSMAPRTGRYNNDLALQSQEAANTILKQLNTLGLHNRGLLLRDSENGTLFPDGSQADYYAIPRYSQMYGIRGFIIEHGFINHTSDLTLFLSTEEQYKALGEADAKGIMEYLQKAGKSTFTQTAQANQTAQESQTPQDTNSQNAGTATLPPVSESKGPGVS
ncbi:N-acetylmuramoyl-L-alanine amidase family protein [Lacrimispora brassicae]